MKKFLRLLCGLVLIPLMATAHQTDPWTIIYGDDELLTERNPSGKWDPNGNVPPQPEADYYVNMHNAGNVYYRLLPVEGSDPAEYRCNIPILQGNFKIYAKERWSMRGTAGYDENRYIYGSKEQPTGFMPDTYKTLGNPGGDLQIEGGGTWYGCTLSFWPQGHSGDGTPDLIIDGGSKDRQCIAITATGTGDGPTVGHVDFTITTGGVVQPQQQTYTVSMSYRPDGASTPVILTRDVTGLTGSFENLEGLKPGSTTDVDVEVEILDAPVFTNPSNQEQISGRMDLSAETSTTITTPGDVYLLGNISGVDSDPLKAIKGTSLLESNPSYPDAASILEWGNVPFNGTMLFRFISARAPLDEIAKTGMVYYPPERHVDCANLWDNLDDATGNWYPYLTGPSSSNSWSPNIYGRSVTGMHYNVYLNLKTHKVAVGWSSTSAAEDITAMPQDNIVDVYNLQGTQLRHGVAAGEATAGLPAGIYIVGGEKIAVK